MLKTIKSGNVYRAYKSRTYAKEYQCLIDMLGLHCESPIFGCLKYHRKNTGGRISNHAKLILRIPNEHVHLTEYSDWADFMYLFKFTTPDNYANLVGNETGDISQRKLDRVIASIKHQRSPWAYRVPQVVLEEIRPEWLIDYKIRVL